MRQKKEHEMGTDFTFIWRSVRIQNTAATKEDTFEPLDMERQIELFAQFKDAWAEEKDYGRQYCFTLGDLGNDGNLLTEEEYDWFAQDYYSGKGFTKKTARFLVGGRGKDPGNE